MKISKLKIALFVDLEDWIEGTIAHEVICYLGQSSRFEFIISSDKRIYGKPIHELNRLGECDLIHWISPGANLYFGSIFSNKPQIVTIHHCMEGDSHWPMNYKGVNRFLTVSNQSKNDLIERGFVDIEVIYNGIDPEVFTPLDKNECRQKLKLNDIPFPLIGFFGKESSNLKDRKGSKPLADVLKNINRNKQVGLLLSGEGWDELIGSLIASNVPVFQRHVKDNLDMPLLYGAIDLYLCTSRIEGGPVPVLEAMASSRPVVTTPAGHVPELIQHGENGLIVGIDDIDAIASEVQTLLDDSSLMRKLGENGRKTILKKWTWDAVLQPLTSIYQSVVKQDRPPKKIPFQYTKDLFMLLARALYYRI